MTEVDRAVAAPRRGLLRATLTLLAGGALAQALPLLLGPWLTRLYTPAEFGVYHLFAAVAAMLAAVACGRYEFALPLATDEAEADALHSLALWLLIASTGISALTGAVWAWTVHAWWPLWLPLAVAALGAVSLATLAATRAQRFRTLAAARVVQHGGGALAQGLAGVAQVGVVGLIAAPLLAVIAAVALLRLRLAGWWRVPRERLAVAARRHRDFPLLNTPHAFAGTLLETLALALVASSQGVAAAGFWGLVMRYLKAPATLVGSAVSQALYPRLAAQGLASGRRDVRRVMAALAALAAPLVLLLWAFAPWAFEWAFGLAWRDAGELARALALYIGLHFIASPLAVVTMAWNAQAWALKLALFGQVLFLAALAGGLAWDGLRGAGWAVSLAMALYFGAYFWRLANWPLKTTEATP
jgi:O-antigen/teichoic acid export membrane protein